MTEREREREEWEREERERRVGERERERLDNCDVLRCSSLVTWDFPVND